MLCVRCRPRCPLPELLEPRELLELPPDALVLRPEELLVPLLELRLRLDDRPPLLPLLEPLLLDLLELLRPLELPELRPPELFDRLPLPELALAALPPRLRDPLRPRLCYSSSSSESS